MPVSITLAPARPAGAAAPIADPAAVIPGPAFAGEDAPHRETPPERQARTPDLPRPRRSPVPDRTAVADRLVATIARLGREATAHRR